MRLANIFFYTKVKVDVAASLCFLKWRHFSTQTWEWVTDVNIYFDSDVLGLKVFSSGHLKKSPRTVRWVLFLLRGAGDIYLDEMYGKTLQKTSHRSRFGIWKKTLRISRRLACRSVWWHLGCLGLLLLGIDFFEHHCHGFFTNASHAVLGCWRSKLPKVLRKRRGHKL